MLPHALLRPALELRRWQPRRRAEDHVPARQDRLHVREAGELEGPLEVGHLGIRRHHASKERSVTLASSAWSYGLPRLLAHSIALTRSLPFHDPRPPSPSSNRNRTVHPSDAPHVHSGLP